MEIAHLVPPTRPVLRAKPTRSPTRAALAALVLLSACAPAVQGGVASSLGHEAPAASGSLSGPGAQDGAERCVRGDGPSCLRMAAALLARGEAETAAAYLQVGCAEGSAAACARLADQIAVGRGVPIDYPRAAALRERACAGGRSRSCGETSRSLRVEASSHDPAARASFDTSALLTVLRAACSAGDGSACFDLATAHQADIAPPDPAGSDALVLLACVLGAGPGCGRGVHQGVGRAVGQGVDPGGALSAYERAWIHAQACSRGSGAACYALGVAYAQGGSLPQDGRRAASLYERACDAGEAAGCREVARLERTPRPLVALMPMPLWRR